MQGPLLLIAFTLLATTFVGAADETDFEDMGLHYGKYLKEVVAALDKDQKFTETIKNMDAEDIKSGKVAEQLKHVHEDVRKKLNELKYLEIKRLRDLATRKHETAEYGETYHGSDKRVWRTLGASLSELPEHLGTDGTSFDIKDLHKLMVSATNDLEKLDKERREDYKTYEMEKEWQFQERLKMMNETEKQEAIKLREELKKKHDDHPKVHEPGSRKQFEEVWAEQDHLPKEEFNPKTFFNLHDTNSDGYWDPQEVRKLLNTEISKMYDPNNPEDDPNQMEEEYERMREHVYKEIDLDRDSLISSQEFLDYSKKEKFNNDSGWEDIDKQKAYQQKDYDDYIKHRDERLKNMKGWYDPAHYANQPNNLHLPDYGYGMPAGANPAQYYGYHIDPNHPQAQQMLAHQQQMAYHQAAAYQQQAGYQHPAAVPQHPYQQPQANQQYYQGAGAQQNQVPVQQPAQLNYQQPQQGVPAQQAMPQQQGYQQPHVQQPVAQQQQPNMIQQQQPIVPQQPIAQQQQPISQQQQAVPQQQQAIPQNQQPIPQQQQQQPMAQAPMSQQQAPQTMQH